MDKKLYDLINWNYLKANALDLYKLDVLPPILLLKFDDVKLAKTIFTVINIDVHNGGKYLDLHNNAIMINGEDEDQLNLRLVREFVKNHPEHSSLTTEN